MRFAFLIREILSVKLTEQLYTTGSADCRHRQYRGSLCGCETTV